MTTRVITLWRVYVTSLTLARIRNVIGFQKGCRTADHMFILTTLIDKYVKKLKTPLYVCFVDFKKAYDCVWRQALLYKLLMVNINGLFFNILKSMYANNEICVRVSNSQRSRFFTSNVGVRQGDAISPILFNLYEGVSKSFEPQAFSPFR